MATEPADILKTRRPERATKYGAYYDGADKELYQRIYDDVYEDVYEDLYDDLMEDLTKRLQLEFQKKLDELFKH